MVRAVGEVLRNPSLMRWLFTVAAAALASSPRSDGAAETQPTQGAVSSPLAEVVHASDDGLLATPVGYAHAPPEIDRLSHFHGLPRRVFAAAEEANLDAVVQVVNRGSSTASYEAAFAGERAFAHLTRAALAKLEARCGRNDLRLGVSRSAHSARGGAPCSS